jgi:hypothetical protein
MARRGGHLHAVLSDICAFANTNGGTIFVGLSDNPVELVVGVNKPKDALETIRSEVEKKITPPLDIEIDQHQTQGKKVLQISVPVGADAPYAIDDYKIYVRDETDTNLAVRDEIVALVKRSLRSKNGPEVGADELPPPNLAPEPVGDTDLLPQPKTGVEIVLSETRKGKHFYSLKDLRNGDVVHNVTRKSARKLWQYALTEHETNAVEADKIEWHGDIGLWKKYRRGGQVRYDLVQREPDQTLHVYYGVTEDGIHGPWLRLFSDTEENGLGS